MKQRVTAAERLRYEFDKSVAAGPIAVLGWLALAAIVVVVLAGLLLAVAGIGLGGGDGGAGFRLDMPLVALAAILIVAALIGFVSAGVDARLFEMRKGRSRVVETGHIVVFNWSASIFDVLFELSIANSDAKRACIVVMADKDKAEMEDEIALKVGRTGRTRIICRSGDPTDPYDLSLASPQTAGSVIVLSPEADDPDAEVLKTVLSLVDDPQRGAGKYRIAAEFRDAGNADLARTVGGDEVRPLMTDELIAKIVVQSSRQPGLSAVVSELLGFEGCTIHIVAQPSVTGLRFGDAMLCYEASTLIGLCEADGSVRLNPSMDEILTSTMRAIIIAADADAIKPSSPAPGRFDIGAIRPAATRERRAEQTLLLGWNRRGPMIVHELSRSVAPGSLLTVAADTPELESDLRALNLPGDALHVEYVVVDTSRGPSLEALDVPAYDHVFVLGCGDHRRPQPADTRTLMTLLHLRRIAEQAGRRINVVSEMTEIRNGALAGATRADDVVVANRLASLMLAQVSENAHLAGIFDELLDPHGADIHMRPIEDYVSIDGPVTFYTVSESARRRGEIAFGHRRLRGHADDRVTGGVFVNPPKSVALDYIAGDKVVVLVRD